MIAWLLSSSLLLFASGMKHASSTQTRVVHASMKGAVGGNDVLAQAGCPAGSDDGGDGGGTFQLRGLTSPATVANTIFVDAPGIPATSAVTYFLDDQAIPTNWIYPFAIDQVLGQSLQALPPGLHCLRAEANLLGGGTLRSNFVTLDVVTSINSLFSAGLSVYANQPSAQTQSLDTVLQQTSTPGATLSGVELAVRRSVVTMYLNWGIDPSLDSGSDQSDILLSLNPQGWLPGTRTASTDSLSMLFSPDAPFYQAIPNHWPRVLLPSGYIRQVQLNTVQAGDGIGFGESVADPADPVQPVQSKWYDVASTLKSFPFRISPNWAQQMPWQPGGDHHMIFIDPTTQTFVSSYMTSINAATGGASALYASSPTPLGTLGDRGGSIAAGFAELPAMLQPGEATDPYHPIPHALGGAVGRVWAARVYPASAWDANVLTSTNTCTGSGFTNTGLVPYGGVIQLDPQIDLTTLGLTLPAFRILESMQTYGYYVEDFGCSDLDIYTAVSEAEFDPYGGLWGYNGNGAGVQNEIGKVLASARLYVVSPLVKKQ